MEQIANMLKLNDFDTVVLFDFTKYRHKPRSVIQAYILYLRFNTLLRRKFGNVLFLAIPVTAPNRGLCFVVAFACAQSGGPAPGALVDAILANYNFGVAHLLYPAVTGNTHLLPAETSLDTSGLFNGLRVRSFPDGAPYRASYGLKHPKSMVNLQQQVHESIHGTLCDIKTIY